jgi:hypothetical protein
LVVGQTPSPPEAVFNQQPTTNNQQPFLWSSECFYRR